MSFDPATLLLTYVAFVFSLVFHEFAHAWAATRLGDGRPGWEGRLTLDPRPHLDMMGSVLFPILGLLGGGMLFGWAKPVRFEPWRLRNPARDTPLVYAAGPGANLVLAFVAFGFVRAIGAPGSPIEQAALQFAGAFYAVNLSLLVFNLVPLPPLDGAHIAAHLLPRPWGERLLAIDGMLAFILLIVLSRMGVFAVPRGIIDGAIRLIWSL